MTEKITQEVAFVRPDKFDLTIKVLQSGRLRLVYREYLSDKTKRLLGDQRERIQANTKIAIEHVLEPIKQFAPDSRPRFIQDSKGMLGLVIEGDPDFILSGAKIMCEKEIPMLGRGIEGDREVEEKMKRFGLKVEGQDVKVVEESEEEK